MHPRSDYDGTTDVAMWRAGVGRLAAGCGAQGTAAARNNANKESYKDN